MDVHLKPGKWSDGKPLTADDGAWTGNLILKYAKTPTVDARAVPLARDQADGAQPDDARDPVRQGRRECPAAAAAVLHPAAPRLGAGRRHGWQGPQGLRPGGAPPDRRRRLLLRHEVRQEGHDDPRAQPRLLRQEAARSTPSASPGSRTPTRCSPRSRAATSTTSTRCRSPSPTSSASRVTSSSSRARAREVRDFGFNSKPEEEEEPRAARSRRCATPSRTRSTASRSSTSCSAGTRTPRATLLTPISAPYMNTEAAAREVRPRARQLDARQARLQAGIGRHPAHAGGRTRIRWPTT